MAKLSKDRLIFGVFLIIVVALGEIILREIKTSGLAGFYDHDIFL